MMNGQGYLWAIVLAGGSGERLQSFLRARGYRHPIKQFCEIVDGRTMLEHAWRRAELLVPPERVVTVIDASHLDVFGRLAGRRGDGTVIVQPSNRDTAPGVLLPLTHVLRADPEARVVLLPSDHFVEDDERFMQHVEIGEWLIRRDLWHMLLLALMPERPDASFGWIEVESTGRHRESCVFPIIRFWEKPPLRTARRLYDEGQLWSSMVTVARAKTLWSECRRVLPGIHERFERILAAQGAAVAADVAAKEYRDMPSASLSKHVFERSSQPMAAIPVRGVYWNDLGCEERVIETLRRLEAMPTRGAHMDGLTR